MQTMCGRFSFVSHRPHTMAGVSGGLGASIWVKNRANSRKRLNGPCLHLCFEARVESRGGVLSLSIDL